MAEPYSPVNMALVMKRIDALQSQFNHSIISLQDQIDIERTEKVELRAEIDAERKDKAALRVEIEDKKKDKFIVGGLPLL